MTIYADFRISVSGETESTSGGDGGGTSSEITVNKHSAINGNIQLYSDTTKLINPTKGTVYEAVVSGFDTELLYVEGTDCDITVDISNMYGADTSGVYALRIIVKAEGSGATIQIVSSSEQSIGTLYGSVKSVSEAAIGVPQGFYVYEIIANPGAIPAIIKRYPQS
ncbi:hypothetical protein QF52_003337 [Salmonella enterica subsp. enterica]|nr:hypothetical protein [Salmonella enterica subsp. enterica]